MITNPVAIFSILSVIVFSVIWLERFRSFRKLGVAAASILLAMVLSNAALIPGESSVYDFFTGYGVLAGTVLILLGVDLNSIRSAGSTMVLAFLIGAVGSVAGAVTMGFLLHPSLGEDTYKLCGQFAATYIGGGMNFAAVGHAFGTSGELFTAGIAADVIITAFWLVACLAAPILLRSEPSNDAEGVPEESIQEGSSHTLDKALFSSGKAIALRDIGCMVAITVTSIWVSSLLADRFPLIPAVFWLTTLVLILAQLPTVKRLTGSTVMGNYLIMLFLACNGAQSVIAKIVEVGPGVFYFAAGTVAIHGLVIFGVGRLMRFNAGTIAVASQANVGGGASAMAIATARGYNSWILPGVAVGLIGYAIGNYIGLAVGNLMRIIL
jgi:uncharacterized membrane protein